MSDLEMYLGISTPWTSACWPTSALCVYTTGRIDLYRVAVEGPSGSAALSGAVLDNRDSVSSPRAGVTVVNSRFSDSGGQGLLIRSAGTVIVSDVQALRNEHHGVNVDNTFTANFANVIFKGVNTFMGNDDGLWVETNGHVIATELNAYDNAADGVYMHVGRSVNIERGTFKSNGIGLNIDSQGPITAKNLTSISNRASGLSLSSNVPVTAEGVNLSNVDVDSNGDAGIVVLTNGGITVGCADIHDNDLQGLYVRDYGDYGTTGYAASLNLPGSASYANGLPDDIHTTTPPVWTPMVCP